MTTPKAKRRRSAGKPLTWTRAEWVKWWGRRNAEMRDFLWDVMVETYKRDSRTAKEKRR